MFRLCICFTPNALKLLNAIGTRTAGFVKIQGKGYQVKVI